MPPTPRFRFPEESALAAAPVADRVSAGDATAESAAAERMLKNVRYIVASVNDDALKVWADLWCELKDGVTPAGLVLPKMSEGFVPSCGWPAFLEKLWLLKHYLDYIHRFCTNVPKQ
jgi:hypothetical protein